MQNKRQIALDTETTGLNPQEGHRIIEIGCVEIIDRRVTKNTFHVYLNPDRLIDEGAIKVHGITNEFLQDKPHFSDIVDEFLEFTRGAELIIHNAPFDVGFLNHELALIKGLNTTVEKNSTVFDTLPYARKEKGHSRASLDALCKNYDIDNSHRELHGALLDAEILAEVYLAMTREQFSVLSHIDDEEQQDSSRIRLAKDRNPIKIIRCSDQEQQTHETYLAKMQKNGPCQWLDSEHV
jgi:DNA polymerase-3 subunit epsilon